MAQQYAPGGALRYTNGTGSTIASGSIIALPGGKLAIALADIPDGESGTIAVHGAYKLPKLSTDAVTLGAKLYWDSTNQRLTLTASGNTEAGFAYEAAAAGVTEVACTLNGLPA